MAVQIELPVPFPLGSVNAWLFPGDQPVLVDCGIGGTHDALLAGIREAGVDPSDLQLYITHGHVDHAGNAHALHAGYGVPLIAPRAEAPFVETFRADEGPRNDRFAAALHAHGMPAQRVETIRQESDAIDAYLEDCPIDREPAPEVVFGDQRATTLPTPGHTPGSTCWVLEEHILTGDTLLERITSNAVELKDEDRGAYHQYVQSLDGLRRFIGMEALPGHHAAFQITDAVLDHHLERHRRRRHKILDLLDRPKTAWQLFPDVFPGLHGEDHHFMGMAEIVGHLHSLQIDGLVTCDDDGVRRWMR
ncbi:MAG: MBL fold metallo-hydrolase [Thermoplasmatota archaeon]